MTLYAVAGLSVPIDLPVPLTIRLVPVGQTNQRPGITRQTPGYWVQHETANYNAGAGALMHCTYLLNGAGGQVLSYHFTVDDKQIFQMIPINEVTWQAADSAGPGNMSGISCELCVNSDSNWDVARHNAEALAGGVMKALGMGVDRCKRHYDFNQDDPDRHFCPKEMMTSGYWPTFVANVGQVIGGTATVPKTPDVYPLGMDDGVAEYLFGPKFNPKGPVSKKWIERGNATGSWPRLEEIKPFDTRTYYRFSDGWTLWKTGNGGVKELKS